MDHSETTKPEHWVNPFRLPGKWYKANLHCHTTTSDGELSPACLIEGYRDTDYSVVALTDHRTTNDVAGLSDEDLLVVSGMEYHPLRPTGEIFHLVGIHLPHGFTLDDPDDANRSIAQVKEAGGETILAHPYWCGQDFGAFSHLKGLVAMEVFNGFCDRRGRGSSENEWSQCLDRGSWLMAAASDDFHSGDRADFDSGWTWLKMPSLSPENVLNALRTGACYASSGPEIHDYGIVDGQLHIACSPARRIFFMGGPAQGQRETAPEGECITSAVFDVPDWPFVRAVVQDATGRRAWTQPLFPAQEHPEHDA